MTDKFTVTIVSPRSSRGAGLHSTSFGQSAKAKYYATLMPSSGDAKGLNQFGQLVYDAITGGTSTQPVYHPFIWTPTTRNGLSGTSVTIGSISGSSGDYAYSRAINDFGQVIGSGRVAPSVSGGFIWTPSQEHGSTGTMRPLGPLPWTTTLFPSPHEINSRGDVAGYYQNNVYLWQSTPQNASDPTPARVTVVGGSPITGGGSAINDRGQIIRDSGTSYPAVVFTPSSTNGSVGTVQTLPLLPDTTTARALALNEGGAVAGSTSRTGSISRPTVWIPQANSYIARDLGTVAGATLANYALDLNDRGIVIGCGKDDGETEIPWVWRESGGIKPLTTAQIVNANALRITEFSASSSIVEINNRGQIAANLYINSGATRVPALLTPGEPGDTNFSGAVDFDDLLRVAQAYGQSNADWMRGDSTGDGVVNFDDLLLLSQNYGAPVLQGDRSEAFDSHWRMARSLVPETSSLAMFGGICLTAQRRSRSATVRMRRDIRGQECSVATLT